MKPVKLGVALFDYGIGVDGSGHTITFSSPNELSDDWIWITDLDDDYVNVHLSGRSRFKSDMYFGRRLKTIINDLGLQVLHPNELAQVLHVVLGWSFESSESYLGKVNRLTPRLVTHNKIENRQRHLKTVIDSLAQRYCTLETPASKNNPFLLYRPASEVYRGIADSRYPTSSFRIKGAKHIDMDALFSSQSDIAFVKIDNPQHIKIISEIPFWNMRSRCVNDALWMTLPEYRIATEWIGEVIELAEGLAANSFTTLADSFPLAPHKSEGSELQKTIMKERLSYSLFLIFEAILSAHLGIGDRRVTFSEIYLASLVRLQQIPQVAALQESGIKVQGYGGGRIALCDHPMSFSQQAQSDFLQLAYDNQLLMPATDFNLPFQSKSNTAFDTFFSYVSTGDSNSLCQLNHFILNS